MGYKGLFRLNFKEFVAFYEKKSPFPNKEFLEMIQRILEAACLSESREYFDLIVEHIQKQNIVGMILGHNIESKFNATLKREE